LIRYGLVAVRYDIPFVFATVPARVAGIKEERPWYSTNTKAETEFRRRQRQVGKVRVGLPQRWDDEVWFQETDLKRTFDGREDIKYSQST
jgi:hypothetical protein